MLKRLQLLLLVALSLALISLSTTHAQETDLPLLPDLIDSIIAEDAQNYTLFSAALSAHPDVAEMLANPDAHYTVFLPDDEAWLNTESWLRETMLDAQIPDDPLAFMASEESRNLLLNHIVPGAFPTENLPSIEYFDYGYLGTALPGSWLDVSTSTGALRYSNAQTTDSDQFAQNGVVHEVNGWLLPSAYLLMCGCYAPNINPDAQLLNPPSENAETFDGSLYDAIQASPDLSLLASLIDAADPALAANLQSGGPFTILAYTDEGIEYQFTTFYGENGVAQAQANEGGLADDYLAGQILPGMYAGEKIREMTMDGAFRNLMLLNGGYSLAALGEGGVSLANTILEAGSALEIHTDNGVLFITSSLPLLG
jgi:uncharacterized surface protein with fasciclin (FAS1) repeats